jgi:hypothetical protein
MDTTATAPVEAVPTPGRRKRKAREKMCQDGSTQTDEALDCEARRSRVALRRQIMDMVHFNFPIIPLPYATKGPFRRLSDTALDIFWGKVSYLDRLLFSRGGLPPFYLMMRRACVVSLSYYSQENVWSDQEEQYLIQTLSDPIMAASSLQGVFAVRGCERKGGGMPFQTHAAQVMCLQLEAYRAQHILPGENVPVAAAHLEYLESRYDSGAPVVLVGLIFASQRDPDVLRLGTHENARYFEVKKLVRCPTFVSLSNELRDLRAPASCVCDPEKMGCVDSPVAIFGIGPTSRAPLCGSFMIAVCCKNDYIFVPTTTPLVVHPVTGEFCGVLGRPPPPHGVADEAASLPEDASSS